MWGLICVVNTGKQTSHLSSFEIVEVEKALMCIRSYFSSRHSGWSGTCLIIKGWFSCVRGIIDLKPVCFFMLLVFAWAEWTLLTVSLLSNWSWFTGNKYVLVLRGTPKYLWHRTFFQCEYQETFSASLKSLPDCSILQAHHMDLVLWLQLQYV